MSFELAVVGSKYERTSEHEQDTVHCETVNQTGMSRNVSNDPSVADG